MFLESLEVDNFKSFGNKRRIVFRKGFTVISGPNGSGKSNIGDAIVFVLGTRSSKSVRAERISDLIHRRPDGTSRKNYASVSVVLDTEDTGKDPMERKIVITREIINDGDDYKSNYLINGKKARLFDIEALLDSLHIYLDNYSFVLQGDINNVVRMTGFERRKLLESISGIEMFDTEISKAQGEIQKIQDNLTRLEVMLEQTRIRRNQLESEKAAAERYIELSTRLKDLKQTKLNLEIESIARSIASFEDSRKSMESEIVLINSKIADLEQRREEKKIHLDKLKLQLDSAANSELKEIRLTIENRRIEIAQVGISIDNLNDRIQKIDDELSSSKENIESHKKRLAWLESNKVSNASKLEDLNKKLSQRNSELFALRKKISMDSSDILDKQNKIKEKDDQIKELNHQIEGMQEERQALMNQRAQLLSRLGTSEERIKDVEFQVKDATWRLKEIGKEHDEGKTNFESVNKQYYVLKNALDNLRKKKDQILDELNRLGREHSQLQAVSLSRLGSSGKALSTIMDARNSGRLSGVRGTIRDLITFDEQYRKAIESSAGSRLNSVVVNDDGVAEECLKILKAEKAGKLTFIPINKMVSGRPRGKAITVHASEGAVGYVFEQVKYDPEYEGAIWYAFQDTVIVKDVQTARKYMVGVRLVTVDGDIFEASGAITGGYSESSRNNQPNTGRLNELSARIVELNSELEKTTADIELKDNELERISQMLRESSKNEGSKSTEIKQLESIIENGKAQIENMRKDAEKEKHELEHLDAEISRKDTDISKVKEELRSRDLEKNDLFQAIKDLSPKFAEKETLLQDEVNLLSSQVSEFTLELTKIDSDMKNISDRIEELGGRMHTLESDKVSSASELKGFEAKLSEMKNDLVKLQSVEEKLSEQYKGLIEEINKVDSEIRSLEDRVTTERSLVTTKNDLILEINIKINSLESRRSELNKEMEENGGKVLDEIKSDSQAKREMDACNSDLNSLGPVNQKAIEEYAEVTKSLEEIEKDISGFREEKSSLEALTDKLNNQKQVIFMETFTKISGMMSEIYREISDGGEAFLEISNDADPLNSEIYIRANPKGKGFSKVEALSGGEKSLTALSFIMALQRTNPSPVYYLDEVDMFLDGANAERVGKMFKRNSFTSQVFTVSLRKAMLKYADNVIGVTTMDDENTDVFEKFIDGGDDPEVGG